MKSYIHISGVAAACALVMGAISATAPSSAFAGEACNRVAAGEPSAWEARGTPECLKAKVGVGEFILVITPGKLFKENILCNKVSAGEPSSFEDAACTKAKNGGGFAKIEDFVVFLLNGGQIPAATRVKLAGTLLLSDLKQKVELQCAGKGEGTVGPGDEDVTTSLTATSCTNQGSTSCPTPNVLAQKLPWKTELNETSGGAVVDEILNESGWQVTCAGIIKDTCLAAAGVPYVEVTKLSAVVEESFVGSKNEDIATCSLGGKEGDVVGSFTIEGAEAGNSISVS